jgi:hypothetical protein
MLIENPPFPTSHLMPGSGGVRAGGKEEPGRAVFVLKFAVHSVPRL